MKATIIVGWKMSKDGPPVPEVLYCGRDGDGAGKIIEGVKGKDYVAVKRLGPYLMGQPINTHPSDVVVSGVPNWPSRKHFVPPVITPAEKSIQAKEDAEAGRRQSRLKMNKVVTPSKPTVLPPESES